MKLRRAVAALAAGYVINIHRRWSAQRAGEALRAPAAFDRRGAPSGHW